MICLLECEECTYTDETCHPNRLLLSLKWELASVSPFSLKKKKKKETDGVGSSIFYLWRIYIVQKNNMIIRNGLE